MAVTNYTPSASICRYSYSKLKDVIYLVSKSHTKDVYIDNGDAYISDISELPLRLNGFNISLNEESSLDERYRFSKTVTLSMHGYVNPTIFGDRYYIILQSYDGTYWMVNPDFPARLTYTFNLAQDTYQTDFTLALLSNFPTLRLVADFEPASDVCLGFNVYGIESLKLLEKEYCTLDTVNRTVHTYGSNDFKTIDYLGNSCSFQEVFDGEKITSTISFNIGFDAYKSSWHYNLLEFVQNLYAAIITPKGGNNAFFAGFNFGLQPSFVVQTQSEAGASDIITVTLTESSNHGSTAAVDWQEEQSTETRWVWTKQVGTVICYECVGYGQAKYLVQQEVSANGTPTGNYKALEGYSFPTLNIVGTFSNVELFNNPECAGTSCNVNTNLPLNITFNSQTCYTYSYSASCDWNVGFHPSYLSINPTSGTAGNSYTITVCNTETPTTNKSTTFSVTAGDNVKVVNVNVSTTPSILNPSSININCLQQNVTFSYNTSCPITVTNIDSRLTYQISNSQLVVNVPRNYSTASTNTWSIVVKDCNNASGTSYIYQDKTYEKWVNTSDYLCESGNSYVRQERYTGTTSGNTNTATGEYRAGALITSGDSRCSTVYTRWSFNGTYYCVDGNKLKCEEEEISYDNVNWTKTGNTRLGEMVEASSSFCSETVQYEWRLTNNWQCEEQTAPNKLRATYSDNTKYTVICNDNSTLTSGETMGHSTASSAMTSAVIGNCAEDIGPFAFSGCTSLTSVTISDSLEGISQGAFYDCSNLTSINIPSGVIDIGSATFYNCYSLPSIEIPSGITIIRTWTFENCSSLTSVVIPDSVTTIGNEAFHQCSSLSSCTIGSGVTSIGNYAFGYCGSLTSIAIPNSVTTIDSAAFAFCSGLTSCTLGNGLTNIGQSAFESCSGLTSIAIPNSVTTIGDAAFGGCYGLTNISVGSGVTSIGSSAFAGCQFTNITIPNSVTTIGASAFRKCTSLSSCTIGSGVTTIGANAFQYCSGLTSVTIPNSVTAINSYTFYDCRNLSSCTIGSGVTTIGTNAFRNCRSLTSIDIPNSVTIISGYTFYDCRSLTSITIPSGVTDIGNYAFYQCNSLTSITVNATTPPTLGSNAFNSTNDCPIYVPAGSVDTYKAADGWSTYASRIQTIP